VLRGSFSTALAAEFGLLRGGAQRQQALTDAVRYLGKRRLEHTGCQANADRADTRVRQQLNRGL